MFTFRKFSDSDSDSEVKFLTRCLTSDILMMCIKMQIFIARKNLKASSILIIIGTQFQNCTCMGFNKSLFNQIRNMVGTHEKSNVYFLVESF